MTPFPSCPLGALGGGDVAAIYDQICIFQWIWEHGEFEVKGIKIVWNQLDPEPIPEGGAHFQNSELILSLSKDFPYLSGCLRCGQ